MAKQRPAQEVAQEIMSREGPDGGAVTEETVVMQVGDNRLEVSSTTVKRILELLCDESGFLLEEKLQRLLAPLLRDDANLIRLDAIFHALRIENEDDVGRLAKYFVRIRGASAVGE